ncbi:hypothetical protein UB44_13495 [Burkholderiaceae bacterium 26]|nr:hypothetical protein UB44_13495 [Burkholderiaceae bacterium 26]
MARLLPEELVRLRRIDAAEALQVLAAHAKRDVTFQPTKSKLTQRWHANVGGREFELLLNGPKFFDTRTKTGGGGAIDLAIYLHGLSFNEAMQLLRQRGL